MAAYVIFMRETTTDEPEMKRYYRAGSSHSGQSPGNSARFLRRT